MEIELTDADFDYHRGEDNHNSKLTEEKVKAIRRSKGQLTTRELAEIYGVAHSTIARILKGETWRHV